MKYIKKANDLFIQLLITIVYIFGIGFAYLIKRVFDQKNPQKGKNTFWIEEHFIIKKQRFNSSY